MLRLLGNRRFFSQSVINRAAKVTQPAPFFKATAVMPTGEFKSVSLDDYKGKWLLMFYYPLDFTFVCPTEIISYSDQSAEFRKLGCEVLACSVDSHYSHLAWVNTPRNKGGLGQMQIPLLSDLCKTISRDYGVLLEDKGLALRGSFLIDPKGIVRQVTMNDLPVGRSVDESLRLLKAFQFTDKHGEVCPANWQEGSQTMKPDPKGSLSYFSKTF
jgi:alkyl hydroperoxide reductase subunit AhpC